MSREPTTTQRNHHWSTEDDQHLAKIIEELIPLKDRMQGQTERKYSRKSFYDSVAGVLAVRHGIFVTGKACDQRIRNQVNLRKRDEARLRAEEELVASTLAKEKAKWVAKEGKDPKPVESSPSVPDTLADAIERMDDILEDRMVTSRAVDAEIDETLKNLRLLKSGLEGTIVRFEMSVRRFENLFRNLEFRVVGKDPQGGADDNRNSDSKVL